MAKAKPKQYQKIILTFPNRATMNRLFNQLTTLRTPLQSGMQLYKLTATYSFAALTKNEIKKHMDKYGLPKQLLEEKGISLKIK